MRAKDTKAALERMYMKLDACKATTLSGDPGLYNVLINPRKDRAVNKFVENLNDPNKRRAWDIKLFADCA